MQMFLSVVKAILLLCALVVIHEFGHYIVARAFRFGIEEFSVGMGPKILSGVNKKTGIRYSFRGILLGGYVRFTGEDEQSDDPAAFNNQKPWKRLLVILAGPVFNVVAAVVLAVVILMTYGEPAIVPIVAEVEAGSPAYEAGISVDDRIIGVDGVCYEAVEDISMAISAAGSEPVTLMLQRGEETAEITVTPFFDEELQRPRIGITFGQERVRYGLFESLRYSLSYAASFTVALLEVLAKLVTTGQGASDVVGPVGTISMISTYARESFEMLLRLAIMISINLGVFNLIPFPGLDGSRIVLTAVEWIRGKPMNRKAEGIIHLVGMVILFGLIIVLTFRDVWNLF